MKPRLLPLARLVSLVALVGTMVPALLFFTDRATLGQVHDWMFVATVAWFASASLWMEH